MPAFVLLAYFWTKLVQIAICSLPVDCPNQMLLPTSRGCWDPSLLQEGFLAKEALACNMETSTKHNPTNLTHWFDLFYAIAISTVLGNWNQLRAQSQSKNEAWGSPLLSISTLCRCILTIMKNNLRYIITWKGGHDSCQKIEIKKWNIKCRLRLGGGNRHSQ